MRKIICLLLCLTLCSATAIAQSYGHSDNEEYFQSQEYYDSHIDIPHGKVKDLAYNEDDGTISFKIDYFFDGLQVNKNVTFLIDKNTYIPKYEEGISPDIDAFISGEHKWISFFITSEDDEKITNMSLEESTTVHVDRIWDICKNVSVYPSPEETRRNERLKNYGIMVGDPDGNFNPYRILSRAELTKIAVVMSNPNFAETVIEQPAEFTDVDAEHWAYPYIAYAKQADIIDGYPDGSFKPESDITCAEAAKVFVSLLGYTSFAEQNGGYPTGYMKAASRYGIMNGLEIKAEYPITRSDTAIMVCNALDIPLMKPIPGDESAYAIYDGTSLEYPLQTLEIQNFKAKVQG